MDDLGALIYDKNNNKKTKSQVSTIPGILVGTVNNHYNEKIPDKIQVEIPVGGAGKTVVVWAKFMMPAAGNEWGMYYKPEAGDKVIISFHNGNVTKPFILGCVYPKSSKMIEECSDKLNSRKKIKTKGGGEISFENKDSKETITITTKKKSKIVIDDTADKISIIGSNGKNLITINSESGKIDIIAENSISLGAGDTKISLEKSGNIDVECKNFNIKNKANVKVDANKVEIAGIQVNAKATAGMKLESSAVLEAKGTMVKIN